MEQKPGRVLSWLWLFAILPTLLSFHPVKAASEPESTSCAEVYIVQANDWLSKIADKFFGSIEAYPVIMTATNRQHEADLTFARIANPDLIEVGWKLCVPLTSTAETILTEVAAATPVVEPLDLSPPPVTPMVYTLDTFAAEHRFNSEAEAKWIYASPEPIQKYEVLPEYQEIRDNYGYRANYLWNEHLEDDYFTYSGIFDAVPEEIKLFDAPWQTVLPRYRYPPNVTLPTGLTTNQYGWRGHPISLHKPPRTIRIAAVGASTTVGGHSLPHAYPEFLEQWLNLWSQSNGYDIKFEVINAGREGLNSNDIAAVVRYEVLPLDVDYVIYYEGSNQFHPETVVNFPPEYTLGQPPAGDGAQLCQCRI